MDTQRQQMLRNVGNNATNKKIIHTKDKQKRRQTKTKNSLPKRRTKRPDTNIQKIQKNEVVKMIKQLQRRHTTYQYLKGKFCVNCGASIDKLWKEGMVIWSRSMAHHTYYYCNKCKEDIFEGVKYR